VRVKRRERPRVNRMVREVLVRIFMVSR
jgi:hypothetical protein